MKPRTSQYQEKQKKSQHSSREPFSNTTQICSGVVISFGVTALLGWVLDVHLLASIYSGYIPMAPNTATAFVVSGITLFVLSRWRAYRTSWWFAKVSVFFVLFLSSFTLIQQITDIDFGIDQLLFITTKTLGRIPIGYMSPLTAASFLLSGFSILLVLSPPASPRYRKSAASCLATILVFIGFVVILGYLYKTPLLYGGSIVPMALTTAITFIFLGIGLLSAAGAQCWPQCLVMGSSTRTRLMRAFLPVTVAIVIVMGRLYAVIVIQFKSNPAFMSALLAILCMVVVCIIISHIANTIGNAIDIAETKRKLAEIELLKLSQAIKQSPSSVIITDIHGCIEYVNPKFTQLTGYTSDEVIGQNPRVLKSDKIPSGQYKLLWDTITRGGEWRGEFYNRKKNGEFYWEYASISPIRNPEGAITHFLAVKEDITERKSFEAQLAHLADRDPLTNLYNRRRFQEEVEHWLTHARRYGIKSTLLFLDVDNFKYINDTLGHQAGDEILISLAGILRKRLRETDTIARLGGDEFAILLSQVDADKAMSISQQIVDSVRQHTMVINEQPITITVSIGIAMFPEHGTTSETLLKCADLAMYRAKEGGRNHACIFTDYQKTKIEALVNWGKRIGNAFSKDRFVLFLQPIVDLRYNRIFGYEALLRMVDENDNLIYPGEFLKAAEHSGFICDIDQWVVCRGIRLIAEIHAAGKNHSITVNISSKAFTNSKLPSIIKRELTETGSNPGSLVLEITESAVITDLVEAQRFIHTLKDAGCRFALDDFGVGFSSLNHLKHLPVDYLKIDGGFIRNLPNDPADQHLVRAIVEVARGLNKETVAEFVECGQTMQLLSQYGVNYAQGDHIGRPKPVSEI